MIQLIISILAIALISFGNIVGRGIPLDEESYKLQIAEDPLILSKSKNFTVHSNDTIILPCVIKYLPNTLNTFVIWNQCDDPHCNQLRIPLTVNKDNFVEDLRFRVISDENGEASSNNNNNVITVKRNDKIELVKQSDSDSSITNNNNVNMWNLEIRKFSKSDEGCYQCQLNTFNVKTIHYCLKLQTKIHTDSKRVIVRLNDPIDLKCKSDENVRLSHIKWYRNGQKVSEEDPDVRIEKKTSVDDYLTTSLVIKHASLSDTGIYSCKFGHLAEKIQVDVLINGDRSIKSSEIRSNSDDFNVIDSSDSIISSSLSSSVTFRTSNILVYISMISAYFLI